MMNDQRFFDLAMKVIARQATDAERAELDALLASKPELRTQLARLQADVRLAKDVLPLVKATKATGEILPAYARERLQTKVRQTLGRPAAGQKPDRSLAWGWRWILGLAAATAAVVLIMAMIFHTPRGPIVQVAMLDTVGAVRGPDTNQLEILKQQWKDSTIQNFDKTDLLQNWEQNWPAGNKMTVKVIYDRAAGEVRVLLHKGDKTEQKTFLVEQDLADTIKRASDFIQARQE